MDEREARKVQREASEALLDLGVSLPLKEWRLPFMKRPVQWRVTMRRPRLAGQICIVRLYLSMGVSPRRFPPLPGVSGWSSWHGTASRFPAWWPIPSAAAR